jgi:16S rRNA (cytosine967-C5)-methyltransferase
MLERKHAYKVINKVLKNNEMSSSLLNNEAKKIKKSKGNHEFFYTLVKGVIKRKLLLEFICQQLTEESKYKKTDLKIKILLYLGLFQIKYLDSVPDHSAVDTTVELTKELFSQNTADFVNAVLRNYLRNPEIELPKDDIDRIAIEHSYPKDLIEKWIPIFGIEDTEYLAMYFNEFPEINIRVNNIATNIDKLIPYFEKRGVKLTTYPGVKNVFKADKAQIVLDDVAFSEGYYSIQDAAAALVVDLVSPQPEDNILDMFAGPGGKASYMAELMANSGQIIAIDKFPKKVKLIKQNIERLQLSNIKLITQDALSYGPIAPAYDKVLLDVPCSGWGVLGKKSELRWQSHQKYNELLKLQSSALNYAAKFVRLEGYMIYSTCTMNPVENEEQIEKFLKKHPNFELVSADNFIDSRYTSNGYLKTMPHIHLMDGSFGAKLKRKS